MNSQEKEPKKDINEKEFSFKPIHQGLGFHLFSEGLPYQSEKSKTKKNSFDVIPEKNFAGAMSAGKPSFVFQKAQKYNWLYVCKRALSCFFDVSIHFISFSIAFSIFFYLSELSTGLLQEKEVLMPVVALFLSFHLFSMIAQETLLQTSFGKKMMDLKIEASFFQIFIRNIFFFVSLGSFGLGVLVSLFDRKKRCFHDVLTHSQPLDS